MKLLSLFFICFSISANAQIRTANSNEQSGTLTASYVTATDRCVLGAGFGVYADGTNPNTVTLGHTLCRLVGSAGIGTDGFTALTGGNYRETANDIDPATAPCRLEGTVTTTNLIAATCGVDP